RANRRDNFCSKRPSELQTTAKDKSDAAAHRPPKADSGQGSAPTAERLAELKRSIGRIVKGKEEAIQLALTTLFARGHLLIEDVPGVGKTTLAQALANSFQCSFQRIQFTSDLLPSDVIGVSVYNPVAQEFEFKPGPIFANIIVADEINRTTPKTQSALLEALTESQLDRFLMRIRMGYPARASEKEIIRNNAGTSGAEQVAALMDAADVTA